MNRYHAHRPDDLSRRPRITLTDVGAGLAMVATFLLFLMVLVALTAVPE